MSVKEKLAALEMFDVGILRHGFAPHMRDYDVIVEAGGTAQGRYRYRFTHCVEANVHSTVRDEIWQKSWDDLYTVYETSLADGAPEGFVWGVCWSLAYPGLTYVDDSLRASARTKRLGKPMHEVIIETEAFELQLVFHDVIVEKLSEDVSVIDKAIVPLD